mgnify:CR=1 FL=1
MCSSDLSRRDRCCWRTPLTLAQSGVAVDELLPTGPDADQRDRHTDLLLQERQVGLGRRREQRRGVSETMALKHPPRIVSHQLSQMSFG